MRVLKFVYIGDDMTEKKNRAVLYYQGQSFIIWQDDKDNWLFTYGNLVDVNTQSKELQRSLNIVYESIRDTMPRKEPAGGIRQRKRRKGIHGVKRSNRGGL